MGAFFTNLQVLVPASLSAADAETKLDQLIDSIAERAGLRRASTEETPDRHIAIVADGRWISIYDEATEDQDQEHLDRWAEQVSRTLATAAFTTLVHDSDVLLLHLFDRGRCIDTFDSNPEFSGGRRRKKPEPSERAEKWRALIGGDRAALTRVFTSEPVFAEVPLDDLAQALDLDPDRLRVGWTYLDETELQPRILRFTVRDRPAAASRATGPTRLVSDWAAASASFFAPARPPLVIGVAGELRAGFTTRNHGGASHGLRVEVSGTGLGDCFALEQAQLVLGSATTHNFVESTFSVDHTIHVARFLDAALPAGLPAGARPQTPEQAMAANVHVNVIGRGLRPGHAKLQLRIVPLAHEQGGAIETFDVVVRSTDHRPLRAPATVHPHLLSPLEGRSNDVLMIVFDEPRPEAATHVLALIDNARVAFPEKGDAQIVEFFGGLQRRPKTTQVKARKLLAASRWGKLKSSLTDEDGQVCVTFGSVLDPLSPAGFTFGAGVLPSADDLLTFVLWFARRNDTGGELHTRLIAAVDALVARSRVPQAFLAAWDWGGMMASGGTSPYESACMIAPTCSQSRTWALRFIRGIGIGQLWLGPELRAHLPDTVALQQALHTHELGRALRIEVHDVHTVEEHVAPLLPTTDDCRAAVAARPSNPRAR